MHTDFENALLREPVQAILSCIMTYMNHEQRQVLYEKLGRRVAQSPPASLEDEAARMYPYASRVTFTTSEQRTINGYIDEKRSAHITCAGMYTDTIDKLKAENSKMRKALEGIVEMSIEIGVVNWEKIHDTATEALKTP